MEKELSQYLKRNKPNIQRYKMMRAQLEAFGQTSQDKRKLQNMIKEEQPGLDTTNKHCIED